MHCALPQPTLNIHENMSSSSSSSSSTDFPGVYIGGFLQQQRVFAHVLLPGRAAATEVSRYSSSN